jgi:hypothetical protein
MNNDGQAEGLLGLDKGPANEKRSGNAGNDMGLNHGRVRDVANLASIGSLFVVVAEAGGGYEKKKKYAESGSKAAEVLAIHDARHRQGPQIQAKLRGHYTPLLPV